MWTETSVRRLKGVGEKRAALYERLGIATVGDLLRHYPRAYEDWSKTVTAADARPGEPCCIKAFVLSSPVEHRIRRGMTLYRFRVTDGRDPIQVTLFNNRYAAAKVRRGEDILLFGVVKPANRQWEMTSPLIELPAGGQRVRPIYPRTEGLTDRMIETNMTEALRGLTAENWPDVLPPEVVAAHGLLDAVTALKTIHFPTGETALEAARRRLIFEELLVLQIGLRQLKGRARTKSGTRLIATHTEEFIAGLPFTLTGAQSRAIRECLADMTAPAALPMGRLVQGDVGSGKTAVAAGVAFSAIREGLQVAMMAPTEILAEQHAATLQKLLGDTVRVALFTAAVPAAVRKAQGEALARGEIHLAVGTHALLSPHVQFQHLGLVITDEQHRFGVHQRAALAAKGHSPHMLVMSATPIPRTLALMIYGDLDISVLDELPPGRQPIETFAVSSQKRDRAYGYVRKHLDEGRQGYIVCPLVEEGEEPSDLHSATALFRELSTKHFAGYRLGLLHGRMRPAEKEAVMSAFAAGEMQLLISTTVIEVGVDVPNAVIMVVEDADRFGLAQLHQLRGRVGRGKHASTCILISDHPGEENRRRLQVLCSTNDGFRIADEDLKLRGPGDFFGDRQHGLPRLRIADLTDDMPLLREAQAAATKILGEDPALALPEHQPLCGAVKALFDRVGEQGLN